MSERPKLLDLFCGAGGCSVGYDRAGFDVTGVDVAEQPNYPFKFHRADALAFLAEHWKEFDAFHASPPCQGYTTMSNRFRGAGGAADSWPLLIGPIRDLLRVTCKPFVIENVPGARAELIDPVTLHGGMFGLGVSRPRLFECWGFMPLIALTEQVVNPLGVYGKLDGRRIWTRIDGTEQRAPKTIDQARAAMGIDWMTWDEIREAIPPVYTEHIGEQLLTAIELQAWEATPREHYDLTSQRRSEAIAMGAVQIRYPHGTAEVIARKRAAAGEVNQE